MYRSHNEKLKNTDNENNRIAKLRKNQNVRRKEKLQVFGYDGCGHHPKSGDERKKKANKSISDEWENLSKP